MNYPNTIQATYAEAYNTSSVKEFPIGQRLECPNGKMYRYAKMGTSANTVAVAAKLYQSEVSAGNFDALATATSVAVGDTTIELTNGATEVTEDMFEGGYLTVETAAGLGENKRIRANTSDPGTGPFTLYLYKGDTFERVVTAASHTVTVSKNIYSDIIIHPAVATAIPVGIPQVAISNTEFGWAQVHGVASCLIDGTVVIGYEVRVSETLDGAVAALDYDEGASAANPGRVGRCIEVAPDTDFGTIFLTLQGAA